MAIRDRLVQIRVARRERREWREAAAAERMTVSDLVRQAMRERLARPAVARDAQEDQRASG